jgi:glycosyl transferase family 87
VQVTVLVTVLSPAEHVRRGWLGGGEAVLLVAAGVLWWARGRPRPPIASAVVAAREVLSDWIVAAFAAVVVLAFAYELVLALRVPANNWDSLTYHLSRVAAWVQHGGVYWIPNAPTDRMNEFQPLAEQSILWLFVAARSTVTYALPQFVGQLAIVVATYLAGCRLGFGRQQSACAALLFPTLALVALEATTAQNDIVAASFPAVAAALLLVGGPVEVVVAGVAVGLGLGVKLTTLLVLPILVVLAVKLGRRGAGLFGASAAIAFMTLASWSFFLNRRHTGHLLGNGGGRVEYDAPASPLGLVLTSFRTLYRLVDLSGFDRWALTATILGGVIVAVPLFLGVCRHREPLGLRALGIALLPALPFLAPLLVLEVATLFRMAHDAVGFNVNPDRFTANAFAFSPVSSANQDMSAFGPVGGLALLAVVGCSVVLAIRRCSLTPRLTLGLSIPVFVALLALITKYNVWLPRFLIVPVALTSPLLAMLFRRRDVTLTLAGVATATVGMVLVFDVTKPADGSAGYPWRLSEAGALDQTWRPEMGDVVRRFELAVPPRACVGAYLSGDEPSYVLFGPRLERRVVYLRHPLPQDRTRLQGLRWVVLGGDGNERGIIALLKWGWKLHGLGDSWTLAENPLRSESGCATAGRA